MTLANNKRRFNVHLLVFLLCLTAMILMMLHTQTFNVVVLPLLPRKMDFKTLQKTKTNLSLPIRVHIFNRVDGFFEKNVFAECNDKCTETSGQHHYNTSKYVLFLAPRIGKIPPKKPPGQIWIFFGHESPIHHNTQNFDSWKDMVNFTMTQRRDSDIYYGSGGFKKLNILNKNVNLTFYNGKNPKFSLPVKFAWMVSNCHTSARRRQYVNLLIKEPNVTVDIYGGCGSFKCPRSEETSCMNHVDSKYPYYLSFENSLCVDYITEKTFKIYSNKLNVIPIVRGDKNSYEKFLPRNSYINVNKFTSTQLLVKKLKVILADEKLFIHFFDWKKNFMPWELDSFCKLCDFIIKRENTGIKKIYGDYTLWLKGYKDRYICHNPSDV